MVDYKDVVEQIYSQNFHIIDNFLPPENVDCLRTTALQLAQENQFHVAKIGSQNNALSNRNIRRDQIYWLDDTSENESVITYFKAMKTIATTLNQHLYLGLVDFETHFALYSPGEFYKKHVDQFNNKQDRRISCVYYLNTDWETSFGGELKLYNKEGALLTSISPIANRLVCFSSDMPPEVCTTTQTRLSIAGWMKTRAV